MSALSARGCVESVHVVTGSDLTGRLGRKDGTSAGHEDSQDAGCRNDAVGWSGAGSGGDVMARSGAGERAKFPLRSGDAARNEAAAGLAPRADDGNPS